MKRKLYLIGDSISIGYGPFLKKICRPWLDNSQKSGREEALNNLDIPQGANGGDSNMVLEFVNLLQKQGFQTDIIMINCGLHDLRTDKTGKKQVTLEQYENNLQKIAQITKKLALETLWVRTTPVNSEIHHRKKPWDRFEDDVIAYNRVADSIMTREKIKIADLYAFTSSFNLDEKTIYDGVHFSPEIQKAQAKFLAKTLRELVNVFT